MKNKIIAASIAAVLVITFISCDLFRSKRTQEFNLQGQWTVDSIEKKGSDTSHNPGLFALVPSKDSLPISVQFNSDSSYQFINSTDSTKGSYYVSEDKKSLFVMQDSVYNQLNFIDRSDSAFSASTTDSVVYHFKKK